MQVVWVYGAPGVGKSTTAWQLYCDLSDSGLVCGYVDIDQLGMCYPAPAQDLVRHFLKGRALASVVPNYAAADAGVLVVSGVLDPDLADWYVAELDGVEAIFVRLTVDDRELWRRHQERGATAEDFEIVRREARVLDAARLAHSTVETAGLSPREVAAAVRAQLGAAVMTPTAAGTAANLGSPVVLAAENPGLRQVIWVCGPVGVGKSTVAWSVFSALLHDGSITGYVDLQQLGFVGGFSAATNHPLQAANVASLWSCFSATGASHLVLSGAVDAVEQVNLYREALPGAEVRVYRLRAAREVLARRIRARGQGEGLRLAGDRLVNQTLEVLQQTADTSWLDQERLDSFSLGDRMFDTSAATASEVAARILSPPSRAGAAAPDDSTTAC